MAMEHNSITILNLMEWERQKILLATIWILYLIIIFNASKTQPVLTAYKLFMMYVKNEFR